MPCKGRFRALALEAALLFSTWTAAVVAYGEGDSLSIRRLGPNPVRRTIHHHPLGSFTPLRDSSRSIGFASNDARDHAATELPLRQSVAG